MENFYFLCPLCGYRHQVPAYWLSFNPPQELEAEHIDFGKCEPCPNKKLVYDPDFREEG